MEESLENCPALTFAQGESLVTLARQTLAEHFNPASTSPVVPHLEDCELQAHRGTFVTLKKNNELRGCIGSLTATSPIVSGVRDNVLNAAFRDPRFAPLGEGELGQVQIEVSVLTEPLPLDYKDADDLLSKLKPGVDGVILRKGSAGATFLPQVWDQLPRPEDFLTHLCMKAGLASDQWRSGDLSVEVYQVQYFEEPT